MQEIQLVYLLSSPELSCDIPIIKKNVIMESEQNFTVGSVVVYYCNGSSPNTDATTSVCTERGKWIPNPAEYTCDGSQLNSKGINMTDS